MVDIVRDMGWEYVGLLYVMNNYGTKGMKAFKEKALVQGICPVETQGITAKVSTEDFSRFESVVRQFSVSKVKVVIFFGIDTR